jgi:hypothetical protein
VKTGPDATAENESDTQNMKMDPTPSVPPKMSPGAQNLNTGPDDLGTAKN